MDLAKWTGKAKELLAKITEALKALAAALGKIGALLLGKAGPLTGRLFRNLAEKFKSPIRFAGREIQPLLLVLGGLAVLFLFLLIGAIATNSRGPGGGTPVTVSAGPGIPPEELFIPDEPDFLPEFLLEREPRISWSIDDISPYWRSPTSPEFWQGAIRSAVDELMESVP